MSQTLDYKEFRKRIGDQRGREYWRSLEELARDEESFDEFFHQEFPQQAVALDKGVDRRDFMKLMGASVAMAGLAACKQPAQSIVPYVRQPENMVPGQPIFFATAMTLGGNASGLRAESHTGRPTKIEGNPDHPSSLGATDVFMQASVLDLYDPDRSQVIIRDGRIGSWSDFLDTIAAKRAAWAAKKGEGLSVLTETVTSPALAD